MASILYCRSNFTLVFGTGAGLAARADLASLVDETGHQLDIFVVDNEIFVTAELTKFGTGYKAAIAIATATLEITTVRAVKTFGIFIVCHFYS